VGNGQVYRSAARGFAHRFRFTALNPNTGVAWNQARLEASYLQKVNSIVKTHYREIPLDDSDDFQKWLRTRLMALLR